MVSTVHGMVEQWQRPRQQRSIIGTQRSLDPWQCADRSIITRHPSYPDRVFPVDVIPTTAFAYPGKKIKGCGWDVHNPKARQGFPQDDVVINTGIVYSTCASTFAAAARV